MTPTEFELHAVVEEGGMVIAKKPGTLIVCDCCRAVAPMLENDVLPAGWRSTKLVVGSVDVCPECIDIVPALMPGARAREITSTEIIGGPHDGYVRPPRVGTVRSITGHFVEMDWDPGTDHTGLPEDPEQRWSWDVVIRGSLEPLP